MDNKKKPEDKEEYFSAIDFSEEEKRKREEKRKADSKESKEASSSQGKEKQSDLQTDEDKLKEIKDTDKEEQEKAAQEQRKKEEEAAAAAEQQKRLAEEARIEEERKEALKREEEARIEEERIKAENEQKKREEEALKQKQAEEEARLNEEQKKKEEEALKRKQAEEEARLKEEQKKREEEALKQKQAEEEARLEEERIQALIREEELKAANEARLNAEKEQRKREEEEAAAAKQKPLEEYETGQTDDERLRALNKEEELEDDEAKLALEKDDEQKTQEDLDREQAAKKEKALTTEETEIEREERLRAKAERAARRLRRKEKRAQDLSTEEKFKNIEKSLRQLNPANKEDNRVIGEVRKSIQEIKKETLQTQEEKKKIDWKKILNDPQNPRPYEQLGFFDKPRKKNCKQRIFDKEDKRFLNRNWREWLRIILFFLVFYSGVVLFFTICMLVFLKSVICDKTPLDSRWILTQPGLTIFPYDSYGFCLGSLLNNTEQVMVENSAYAKTGSEQFMEWDRNRETFVARMKFMFKKFLEPYKNYPNLIDFGNCSEENVYGFLENSPCFFLKITRIYDFRFQDYENFTDFPGDFPMHLRDKLVNTIDVSELKGKAFIDCEPVPKSREILGGIAYWPSTQMIDLSRYDYDETKPISNKNLLPMITIRLLKPPLWKPLGIVCRLWSQNIEILDDESHHFMGARKLYFNIKDSRDTTNKGSQEFWDYKTF